MFSYIRWFAGGSFIVVVLVAFGVGHYFREVGANDLTTMVGSNNATLAQSFINIYRAQVESGADWYRRFRASQVAPTQWYNYKGYGDMAQSLNSFSNNVFAHFQDVLEHTPIAEVDIYMYDGKRLVSTDAMHKPSTDGLTRLLAGGATEVSREDGSFDKTIASGASVSTVLENPSYQRPDGSKGPAVFIKTFIPVMKDRFVPILMNCTSGQAGTSCQDLSKTAEANPVEAVIEIRYDVTEQWKQLDTFKLANTYGIIAIFVGIISFLLLTSNRAETIIAKQHEANIELAAQAASAQAENRDKSQFLANISHELRTPLNAIIGFSEFIKSERSGPIGNEKYAEYIRDIHSSGVHLLSLINDILDYSKAEADKLELDISEVDATKAVQNCMRLVSPRAEGAQVNLVEEIPREHFIVITDAKKFKQILLNLLSNAVKFTPAGGSVTVVMWRNVVDGSLVIEVKDTGIGIAPKDIARALAPFGQVDSALSRKYEGTGLGLPLTRKFVEIMGGTFNIASEVGKGTTITITVPKEAKGRAAPKDMEVAAETPAT